MNYGTIDDFKRWWSICAPLPAADESSIYLNEFLTAPVSAFDCLAPGQSIDGPVIVESAMTTILLRPDGRAVTTPLGWLDIALTSEAGRESEH